MFGYDVYLADHKTRQTYWHDMESGAQLHTEEEARKAGEALIAKYDLKDADLKIVPKPELREVDQDSVRAVHGRTKVGSKMDRAIEIYHANPGLQRKDYIALFKSELGMTDAGASTYYQTVKSAAQQTAQ